MIIGMDISSYPEMQDRGYEYHDSEGRPIDVIDYAMQKGFNYARLRIWNDPSQEPESGGYCDLAQTIQMAKRIKAHGLPYLLDFHYSDWWADPGHQNIPAAWKGMSVQQTAEALAAYTAEVLEKLKAEQVYPDMIQIGNEIRAGMLFPMAQVPNWENLATLVQAGLSAARRVSNGFDTELMLHLDEGATYAYYEEWFDKMIALGTTDFDLIGLSYYPYIHGTYADFEDNLHRLTERYDKDLVIAEFAHPFRRSRGSFFGEKEEQLSGHPASPKGQRESLEHLVQILERVPNSRCRGYFYWEPFQRSLPDNPEDGWGTLMSLMDDEGCPTEALKAGLPGQQNR